MITEVKNFIESFFQRELDVKNAEGGNDKAFRDKKAKEMYTFCDEILKSELDIDLDGDVDGFVYPEARKLLKISHYTRGENYGSGQEKYPDLFLCYASELDSNPHPDFISLRMCYFVARDNGAYKILMAYRMGEGYIVELDKDGYGWFLKAGREDLLPEEYGKPLTYGVGEGIKAFRHFGILHEVVHYQIPTYKGEGDASITEYEKEI